ncbi:DUF2505 domain-containing protein [Nocardioides sp. AE5]|uniref:DUF2505 domain-containing protein n=1 Tax=Nocardioides sp. AE5 TaxID=2962573 RepID=UPI0028826398|nr:DUF2505 domain-containing protein [Nocardioides sp. AE5]MDT0201878.1 DUF2505 domain-containing protein [Nocardioides sp. AE5]
MKKINHTLVYPGASLDQVVAMVSDPAFREAVADYQGVVRRSVSVTGEVPAKRIEVELVHGTERVPSFAKKFVGDEIPIVQVETWTSDTAADVEVTIPGKPGEMVGSATLTTSGDDVVETMELEVRVKIPLVGGKIEDLIAGLLVKAFKAENKVGLKWLAGEWN